MTDPGGPGPDPLGGADRRGEPALWAGVAAVLLLAHGLAISFPNDDAFISFRYAENWIHGHGLVFNPGERVEGYTNFLWTVVIGILARLGAEPLLAARALGFLASTGTLFLAARLSLAAAPGARRVRLAPLLLAASSPFAYWTFAGLETPLFTFLLLLAVERAFAEADADAGARAPRALALAATLALLALTRPEGVALFALFLVVRLADARRAGRRLARADALFVLGFLAIYVPYFLWRLAYYGHALPNTYYLRRGTSLAQDVGLWRNGVAYLAAFFRDGGGALLLAPLALLVAPVAPDAAGAARRARRLLALVAAWCAYLVWVGGDAKILHRFFVPILPVIYLLVEASLARLLDALGAPGRRTAAAPASRAASVAVAAGAAGLLLLLALPGLAPSEKQRTDRTFFAMLAEGGRWLARNAPPDATVACFAVGALPYYSGLTTYDLLGVTDAHIAHGPLRAGEMTGHGKTDWDYILAKRPTYVFPMGNPDLSPAGYEYAPISVSVRGEVLALRAWRRVTP
jgi:hypothetical protein